VRSETVMPSFSNSPWIRGAPQRPFSVAMRPMRLRSCKSIRGRPGRRRERRLQHGTLHEMSFRRQWTQHPPVPASPRWTAENRQSVDRCQRN
jgi:hypothetical protein